MEFADAASAPLLTQSLRSLWPPVIIWSELSSFAGLQINGHRIVRCLRMSAVTCRVILDTQLTFVNHYSQITEMPVVRVVSFENHFLGIAIRFFDHLWHSWRRRTSPAQSHRLLSPVA